jgi:serine/threonine protein kinase/tetratricopeptide (TPR) repeat protein
MQLAPGDRLGPYEIISALGRGGQGEVYRARDTRLPREVAIKIVADGKASGVATTTRFDREWHAVASLSHPNIVALYDVGVDKGLSYAVMELLEGDSVDAVIARAPVPTRRALEIAVNVANGLAAAHEKGIVHRDLKPANVFVTGDGGVKVLDFGLARSALAGNRSQTGVETESLDTAPGTVMGTVGYMSPEQVKGHVADQRSDIFSFGCILYELLTGHRAFKGQTAAETCAAILRDEPGDLTGSGRRIPLGIEPILRRCLEKRPDQRFQSARDLSFALKAQSDLTGAVTGATVPPRPFFRASWIAMLAAAALIVFGVAAWQKGWLPSPFGGARVRSIAVLPLLNRSGNADQEYLADGITEQLITNLGALENVRVISRTSSMSYKNERKPLPVIARELNVDAIIEGSVVRDGSRVKLNVELKNANTEERLWQDTFDRDIGDVLLLQTEIAEQIARKVALELDPEQAAQLRTARRIDPAAYDAYVRGRYYWNKGTTQPDLQRALDAFNQAIDVDPTYAAAYTGLADSYGLMGYQNYLPPSEAFPKARAAATRATELDANHAAAYASLGYVNLYHDWDFTTAETNFKRAIAIDPNLVSAHHFYSILLTALLRPEEASVQIKLARSLDPLSSIVATNMGFELYYERHYPEAIAVLQDAIATSKLGALAHMWLARTYQAQGRYDDAVREFRASGEGLLQLPVNLAGYGHLQAVSGHTGEARKVLDDLVRQQSQHYVSPYCMALVYLGLRDAPAMKLWLARALDDRANWAVWILKDPRWDPVRGDPEFEKLVDRIGFPVDARRRAAAAGGTAN